VYGKKGGRHPNAHSAQGKESFLCFGKGRGKEDTIGFSKILKPATFDKLLKRGSGCGKEKRKKGCLESIPSEGGGKKKKTKNFGQSRKEKEGKNISSQKKEKGGKEPSP